MTYEYACEACGHTWEAEQRIKDAPLKECVSCGAPKAKRLVSGGTGFLLKGGGWYADGYGSKAASKTSSGDGDGASASSSKPSDSGSKKTESASSESTSSDSGSSGSKASSEPAKSASAAS